MHPSYSLTPSKAGFIFAQQAIPLLLATAKSETKYPATLLFTGATASIKASSGFSAFASAKWAVRALSQCLAKEFGPQGVHVGHIIADGIFETPLRKSMDPNNDGEAWLDTDGMAQSYWALHTQPKRAWSWEIDLRPYLVLDATIYLTLGKMVGIIGVFLAIYECFPLDLELDFRDSDSADACFAVLLWPDARFSRGDEGVFNYLVEFQQRAVVPVI
jgi:NAD(P)-dependent dehydrogenase (short-subunit alcohol dehydrogenase family)